MKKKKAKSELRFARVRRGYDIEAVEAYITLESKRAQAVESEQRERIITMARQIEEQNQEIARLESREDQIKSAIVSATEKANKMTAELQLKYGMELERLNLFRAKWIGVYDELKERYHFDKDALNMESAAISAKIEIERFLSRDFALDKGEILSEPEKQFKSEAERLAKSDSGVIDLRDKLIAACEKKENNKSRQNSAAFSLEEATRPTESLAELCEYLGLRKKL